MSNPIVLRYSNTSRTFVRIPDARNGSHNLVNCEHISVCTRAKSRSLADSKVSKVCFATVFRPFVAVLNLNV